MKIDCSRQLCPARTDRQSDSLSSCRSQKSPGWLPYEEQQSPAVWVVVPVLTYWARTNCPLTQPGRSRAEVSRSREILFPRQLNFGSHCVTISIIQLGKSRVRSKYCSPLGPAGHSQNQYLGSSLLSVDFLLFFCGFYVLTHTENNI